MSKTTNNINKNNEIKTNTIEDGKDDKHNSYESIPPAPPAPPLAVMPPAIISRLYQISARLSIKLNTSVLANDNSKIRKRRGCSVVAYHRLFSMIFLSDSCKIDEVLKNPFEHMCISKNTKF